MNDSTVTGKIFNPDPLTTAAKYYDSSTIYKNNNGLDAPWLDAQQQTVTFKAKFDGSLFTLESPYVKVEAFDTFPPNQPVPTSNTPQFNFNRSQKGFHDVNAFYHISKYHDYVKGLGFDCADSLIVVDTHAIYDDNSFFSPGDYPHAIYFGTGGVPDAEDADVVVHEYCHSLSYTAAPNSNTGSERKALDEGFCDYNAASYSKSLNTFNDQWVYNWDGHNEFWPGRVVNSSKVYPTDLNGSIYNNGEIWSSALFSINEDLGRGATDSLIIQAHYSYAQNISMAYAAQLLIDADTLLNNGAYYCTIYKHLLEHGFVSPQPGNSCNITDVVHTQPAQQVLVTQNGNSFTVLNNNNILLHVSILTVTGQQVDEFVDENQSVYHYNNPTLAPGMYLVNIIANNRLQVYKWANVK
jgi:hypothetical protein